MDKYAVLQIKNKQYLVSEGDTIVSHILENTEDIKVLAVSDGKSLVIGDPLVKDSSIKLQFLGEKRIKTETRRYKSKSRYRKNKSHTDSYSKLKVVSFGSTGSEIELIKEDVSSTTVSKPEEKKSKSSKAKSTISVTTLDLPESTTKLLVDSGFKTISDLKKAKKEDLVSIKGLGEKKVDQILSKLD